MPHPLRCPECGRTLGIATTRHDHRSRPYTRIKLNDNVERVGRSLFRGRYAECVCGERVKLQDGATVEFH